MRDTWVIYFLVYKIVISTIVDFLNKVYFEIGAHFCSKVFK